MKATMLFLAGGGTCIVEFGDGCAHCEEVFAEDVEVPEGTLCGVCGEPIEHRAAPAPEERTEK